MDDVPSRREDTPWLREMVEPDLLDLFSDDDTAVRHKVRALVEEAQEDEGLEGRLIELLETALDLHNDDSQAALWATVVLGEIRSVRAVDVLLRSLASDEDEMLQDAAHVAILRIGAHAVERLMDAIEAEDDLRLSAPGYDLIGGIGFLEDEGLRQRAVDFLESQVEKERAHPSSRGALERLCRALAYLGDRRQIPLLKRLLLESFRGRNAEIRDALEVLEENESGEPILRDANPWLERYGWLFREEEEGRGGRRRSR